jgi:uncharacterized protein YjiS (DUF1127 family)
MASVARQLLINSQASLLWPTPRRQTLAWAVEVIKRWRSRMQQRAQLAQLDQHALRDIGQTDADVYRELAKWFWQE